MREKDGRADEVCTVSAAIAGIFFSSNERNLLEICRCVRSMSITSNSICEIDSCSLNAFDIHNDRTMDAKELRSVKCAITKSIRLFGLSNSHACESSATWTLNCTLKPESVVEQVLIFSYAFQSINWKKMEGNPSMGGVGYPPADHNQLRG